MTAPVLAVSTSAATWSLWLGCDPRKDGELLSLSAPRGAPRDLVGAIDGLLQRAGCRAVDLRGLVADVGPGSFTSLRMGLATLRALAWGGALPVAVCGSLEALLAEACEGDPMQPAIATVAARRGWWYVATQGLGSLQDDARAPAVEAARWLAAWQRPHLVSHEDLLSALDALRGCGPAVTVNRAGALCEAPAATTPSARWLARQALQAPHTWRPPQAVLPVYLAASEAEIAAGVVLSDEAVSVDRIAV